MQFDLVFVTYNSERWLPECLRSLANVEYDLKCLNLFFADNGSQDGTLSLLQQTKEREEFGSFEIIRNGANLGFGAACNRGAAKGSSSYVFFLNVDTTMDAQLFVELEKAIQEHPEAGGFECRQLPYELGHHIDPVTLETSWASGASF